MSSCRATNANRFVEVADARNHAYYEAYDVLGSYPRVARVMGRDHSTVLSGRRALKRIVGDVGR